MARRVAQRAQVFTAREIQGSPQWFARGRDQYDAATYTMQFGQSGRRVVEMFKDLEHYYGIEAVISVRKAVRGFMKKFDIRIHAPGKFTYRWIRLTRKKMVNAPPVLDAGGRITWAAAYFEYTRLFWQRRLNQILSSAKKTLDQPVTDSAAIFVFPNEILRILMQMVTRFGHATSLSHIP